MKIVNPGMFERRPSCVLLDLDDTLYAYEPCHSAAMGAVQRAADAQLGIAPKDFDACCSDARKEIKDRLGRTAASHHRLLYFQRTLELAGFKTQPLVALQLQQTYWRTFLACAELFEEAIDFLDDLRIVGIPIVVVTDLTAEIQFRKIIHLGLDRLVDWVVTSEETGLDKPNPANFELALAKLGGIEGPVWMVGENAGSDIAGARAAVGAIGLQKRHAGVRVFDRGVNRPDAVFDHFGSLRRLLAGLSGG